MSGDEDDEWVLTHTATEEELLRACWEHLPFDCPYAEFRTHMLTVQQQHQPRSRLVQTWDTLWWWSGCATTAWQALQYRHLAWSLLLWSVR